MTLSNVNLRAVIVVRRRHAPAPSHIPERFLFGTRVRISHSNVRTVTYEKVQEEESHLTVEWNVRLLDSQIPRARERSTAMPVDPFDSIESAHEFVTLLSQAVADARHDVDADVQRENGHKSRRADAMKIAAYQLALLEQHMQRSGRILNDLRSLRRLLFDERTKGASKPTIVKKEEARVMMAAD